MDGYRKNSLKVENYREGMKEFMDGAFEKFSVYDFFNIIVSGATFLGGLHLIGFAPVTKILELAKLPPNEFIELFFILLICYIVGFVFQTIEHWWSSLKFESLNRFRFLKRFKFQSIMIEDILSSDSKIIDNSVKTEVYQKKAKELFQQKKISFTNNNFEKRECAYFFAYCIYYIQACEQGRKTEKMRELKGLSSLWVVCFLALLAIDLLGIVLLSLCNKVSFGELKNPVVFALIFLILLGFSYFKTKINTRDWIKMVLSTYDVCSDLHDSST